LMLASGADKADIICRMVEGPIMSEVPATALQMHPRAIVVLDEAAASKLKRREFYKWVFGNKGGGRQEKPVPNTPGKVVPPNPPGGGGIPNQHPMVSGE